MDREILLKLEIQGEMDKLKDAADSEANNIEGERNSNENNENLESDFCLASTSGVKDVSITATVPEKGTFSKKKRKSVKLDDDADKTRKKSKSGDQNSPSEKTKKVKVKLDTDDIPLDSDYIDKLLEEKALRNNLSTMNVKNILRYVVTNEHVLAMVRNSVRNEGEYVEGSNEEAAYEPKLTRSKAKELIEKQSVVPWPISPIKVNSSTPSKKLIEEEFAEDECSSDEEYMPSETIESEEDEEVDSVPSSSPCEPSRLQPLVIAEEPEEDRIALRTRSKLPLVDTPLESIEASFLAPDITIDMYDSDCDDEDWKGFLHEFLKPIEPEVNDNQYDEQIDPEYNFLEEEDVPDLEDLRDDHTVKVTKKELNALMKELLKAAEAEFVAAEDGTGYNITTFEKEEILEISSIAAASPDKKEDFEESLNIFSALRTQLDDQMRKHVQLLTQVFVLSSHIPELAYVAATCKSYVVELYNFSSNTSTPINRPSAFTAHNLEEAVLCVSSYNVSPDDIQHKSSKRSGGGLPASAAKVLAESKAFIYTELLPTCGFTSKTFKHSFTHAEDNLLALGLEQFLSLTKTPHGLIRDHLLPAKTEKQIMIRSKNLRSKKAHSNPVKYLCVHKRTKPLPRDVPPFNPNCVIPPVERNVDSLPAWLKHMAQQRNIKSSADINSKSGTEVPAVGCTEVSQGHVSAKPVSLKTVAILPRPGTTISIAPRISPLKTVSPILKKYSQTRKGRALLLPKMIPRMMCIAPAKNRGFQTRIRPLAPKPISVVHVPENPTESRPVIKKENTENVNSVAKEVADGCRSLRENASCQVQESESDNEADDDGDDTADEEPPDVQDNEDDLAALMAASTTIRSAPRHRPTNIKRNKQQRELETMLAVLVPDIVENDPLREEREAAQVQSYMTRVKDIVGGNDLVYEEFLKLLHNFPQSNQTVPQLYQNVCQILHNYPDLCDEFVGFLRPDQAEECGKIMEYLSIMKMKTFLRKLEVHFSKHPQQVQKIVKVMAQFEKHPSLTINDFKTAILPLFRGQSHLAEELFSLFPQEAPPESAMTDFEEVFLSDADDEDLVEEVDLPDCEDSYGGHNCSCQCHLTSDKLKLQNRLRHCVKCGIKFVDGRVFLQAGKMLRPCQFVYTQSEDEKDKCGRVKPPVKECESDTVVDFSPTSPNQSSASSLSPAGSKDSEDDHDVAIREDDDVMKDVVPQQTQNANDRPVQSFTVTEDANLATDKMNSQSVIMPADFSDLRSVIGPKVDDSSEANLSIPAKNHSLDEKGDVVVLWTRESDRMILQACQQTGPCEETFQKIALQLPGKNAKEVHTRFLELITLFSKDFVTKET